MSTPLITIAAFLLTLVLIFWRPKGINEAIPALAGAVIVTLSGSVHFSDFSEISTKVSGAAITIIATIVMAIVLESFGFFHWTAAKILDKAKGSGIRLFWLINLLCFLMTLFFNNDGSIIITTPILCLLLKHIGLKVHQQIPYLISGALIATASSIPIGVSNIVNLISLKIVNLTLIEYTEMMFIPGLLGLCFLALLLFGMYRKRLPKTLPSHQKVISPMMLKERYHPLKSETEMNKQTNKLMRNMLIFVFIVRISLYIASFISIPIQYVAVLGSLALLAWRWYYLKVTPIDMLRKTPWHIFIFAFSMYVIVYGLHNIGLTQYLVNILEPVIQHNLFLGSIFSSSILATLSNLFNNHPALMVGTIALSDLNISNSSLKLVYLANIVGSDVGSLVLPLGTLATLMWMHILRKNGVPIKWSYYLKVSVIVIPLTVLITLVFIYLWMEWLFI